MNFIRFVCFSCVLLVLAGDCIGILNGNWIGIDVNDILSEKLMPMSILYARDTGQTRPMNVSIVENSEYDMPWTKSQSDLNSALHLMQFHRQMIQNYQCNNYIAKQIFAALAPINLNHRLGTALNTTGKISMKCSFDEMFFQRNVCIWLLTYFFYQ